MAPKGLYFAFEWWRLVLARCRGDCQAVQKVIEQVHDRVVDAVWRVLKALQALLTRCICLYLYFTVLDRCGVSHVLLICSQLNSQNNVRAAHDGCQNSNHVWTRGVP